MAGTSIASAVTVPQDENDHPTEAKGVKRRLSASPEEEKEVEQDNKRQRISPGKISPKAARDGDAASNPPATDAESPETRADPREARRKSSIADEKQRSKRLFGALLGSLNQPRDRTSKRRQEIESRRKAELQRQDDERLEDKQRRQERLAEQRKKAQMKVDQDNMHIRHSNMLNRAKYLQTESEPRIFYKPWDLRPDEEDRIEDQIRDAQAQIDKELDDFDERYGLHDSSRNVADSPGTTNANGTSKEAPMEDDEVGQPNNYTDDKGDQTPAKSANNTAKPAEVPESPTDINTNPPPPESEKNGITKPQEGKVEDMEVDGEHVEGDEDSVIY